jgi:hypothetical protein
MKERNLYFETIEALFYNGKTPKDIDNVRFTNNFGITTIISWSNFADAARKFNYNTSEERHIVNDSLEINGIDGKWQLFRLPFNMSNTEKWQLLRVPSNISETDQWISLNNTDAGEREIDPIELSSFGEDLFKYMEIGTGEETYYD